MAIFSFEFFSITVAPTYYGLAYALGFVIVLSALKRSRMLTDDELDAFALFAFLGVVFGGRLGYVLLYAPEYYLANPLKTVMLHEGGMSFHGAVVGVTLALVAFAGKYRKPLWKLSDAALFFVPVWLMLGRFANFLNNELFGFSPYSGPFPMVVDGIAHFPSPLLEAVLEGPVLFALLVLAKRNVRMDGSVTAAFLGGYGLLRIVAEFFRLPDANLGYFFSGVTLGQILSIAMVILGGVLFFLFSKKT